MISPCPVHKITKCNGGSRWLLDPDKIYEMVSAVVEAVDKPVTVKMRAGWDADHIYTVNNAKAIEAAGATQMYDIPVTDNGDIDSPQIAKQRLEETGVDAIMVGRAALGNPWMIYRTVKYLETGELIADPTPRENCMFRNA